MKKLLYCSLVYLIVCLFSGIAFSEETTTVAPEKNKHIYINLEPTYLYQQYNEASSDLEDVEDLKNIESLSDYNIFQLNHEEKWGGRLGLDLSISFFTRLFRITPGLSFILPIMETYHTVLDIGDEDSDEYLKIKQEGVFAFRTPFKFGFRIKFESFEISPYLGVNSGMYFASIKFNQADILADGEKETSLTVKPVVISYNCGLQFLFLSNSTFGLHIGLEFGYNNVEKTSEIGYDWKNNYGITNSDITKEIIKHVLPVSSGLYFQTSLGVGLNI